MSDFQEKVKEKIRQYSNEQYLDGYIKNEYLTEDGDADIFLKIHNAYEVFDSRTAGHQLDVHKSIYDFINHKMAMLDNDVPINLHFLGYSFTDHEQGMIRHIMKEHYAIELYKTQKKFNTLKNKIFGLVLLGIISFALYSFVYFLKDFNYLVEVFGFLFTFSLWEAMDRFIYVLSEVRSEREAITQALLMNIDFDSEEEPEEDI